MGIRVFRKRPHPCAEFAETNSGGAVIGQENCVRPGRHFVIPTPIFAVAPWFTPIGVGRTNGSKQTNMKMRTTTTECQIAHGLATLSRKQLETALTRVNQANGVLRLLLAAYAGFRTSELAWLSSGNILRQGQVIPKPGGAGNTRLVRS